MPSPYREVARPEDNRGRLRESLLCDDLLPFMILVWLGSVARIAVGLAHHEVFGAEPTVALALVIVLPWGALRGRAPRARS
jgi:hypothetical protein